MLTPTRHGGYFDQEDPGETYSYGPTAGKRRSVSDREAQLLASLATRRTVLEIGTGLGVSTKALASTARKVVTVDPDPWVHGTVVPTLPDNVEAVSAIELIPKLDYDLVFVDGSHTREAVRRDLHDIYDYAPGHFLLVLHDGDEVGPFAQEMGFDLYPLGTEHHLMVAL